MEYPYTPYQPSLDIPLQGQGLLPALLCSAAMLIVIHSASPVLSALVKDASSPLPVIHHRAAPAFAVPPVPAKPAIPDTVTASVALSLSVILHLPATDQPALQLLTADADIGLHDTTRIPFLGARLKINPLRPDFQNKAYTNVDPAVQNPFVVGGLAGQCTAYVWGRTYEVTGTILPDTIRNNAGYWLQDARQAGYKVDKIPAPHSIAVWKHDHRGFGEGHVAFVEGVTGSQVLLSEANWITVGPLPDIGEWDGRYHVTFDTYDTSAMDRPGFTFMGYIHLPPSTVASALQWNA